MIAAVLINSFGVVLMLYSGAGISAISSVPFAFSEVFTKISSNMDVSFSGLLVLTLMILRKNSYRSIYSVSLSDLLSGNF